MTEYGKQLLKEAEASGMINFYRSMLGDFEFTAIEYEENKTNIQKWINNHQDYKIVFFEDMYYLTDAIEL